MEIGGIGDLGLFNNIDGYVNRAKDHANDVSKFEEALRRTADSQGGSAASPAPVQSYSSGPAKIDKTDKLYEQCVELEIFLVKTLISSMRNTVQKSGLINEGYAGKMYEDMLYDEYAKDFAKNANFGMAEMAYLELTGQRGKTVIR
jgi:flagellar protein FlgJ